MFARAQQVKIKKISIGGDDDDEDGASGENTPYSTQSTGQLSQPPPPVKPIVVFGTFDIGKTWFIKHMLTRLGIRNDDIKSGRELIHTRDVVHYGTENPVMVANEFHNFAFFDTEGFHQPQEIESVIREHVYDPKVFALVRAMPGVLVYMTTIFQIADEQMLRILTTLASVDRRIIVVHNRSGNQVESLPGVIKALCRYKYIKFKKDPTSNVVTSVLNGHNIEHFFIFSHTNNGVSHNEKVFDKLLRILAAARPIVLKEFLSLAEEKCAMFTRDVYEFQFADMGIGEIQAKFRYLSPTEVLLNLPPGLSPEVIAHIQHSPDEFRIIELRGPIDLDSVKMCKVTDPPVNMEHFVEIRVSNFMDINMAKEVKLLMWTPLSVVKVVGAITAQHSRMVYVQVRTNYSTTPSALKHHNNRHSGKHSSSSRPSLSSPSSI